MLNKIGTLFSLFATKFNRNNNTHLQSWTWIYSRRLWKISKNLQHSYLPKFSVFQGASVILYHKFWWTFRYKANYYSKYIQKQS